MRKLIVLFFLVVISVFSLILYSSHDTLDNKVQAQTQENPEDTWPMAGANPQRTSHNNVEVKGMLNPIWYTQIEPYIPDKVQIIAVNDTLYISTSKGLYALYASDPDGTGPLHDGDLKWVYPTELPLGHSPTYYNGVVYVGGMDHKLHAINANTGEGLWTYEAEQGFQTNPLVINDIVYLGNRDGYMYAVYSNDSPNKGTLVWRYKTDGPIKYSAAADNTNTVIYFASNDLYAYALNASDGSLVWKSQKLPGAGFTSWWPVVYNAPTGENVVIFSGASVYRTGLEPGPGSYIAGLDLEVFQGIPENDPIDTPNTNIPGDWVEGTSVMDASRITQYFEDKPYRRTDFVLNQSNGQEYTFDTDGDGNLEYAPFIWTGTHSGNRYPPIVGYDNVLYQHNGYISDPYIAQGGISGWKIGTQYISRVDSNVRAVDEPEAYSSGGQVIYYTLTCNRALTAIDISKPLSATDRLWNYFNYDLTNIIPNYPNFNQCSPFGGRNAVYAAHGDQNAPIPYKGKVYVHRGNAVIAFGTSGSVSQRTTANTVYSQNANISSSVILSLNQKLESEVQKIVDSGHLRPGFGNTGIFDNYSRETAGDNLMDYWHSPTDIIYTLLLSLPHLSPNLQNQVRNYLQAEYAAYSPNQFSHIGYANGSARETFILPPDIDSDRINSPSTKWASYGWIGWGQQNGGTGFPPHMFYALWKYAQEFGNVNTIFNDTQNLMSSEPTNTVYSDFPFVLNSFIAGYKGYLELGKMTGLSEDEIFVPGSSTVLMKDRLSQLMEQRANTFNKDTPFTGFPGQDYQRPMSISRNFMYLTPELGQYLHDNALLQIDEAVNEYTTDAPYWFISKYETTLGEGAVEPYYDYNSIFAAKSMILNESKEELVKYLDVPAVETGDLFYIQNLVSAIEAPESGSTTSPSPPSPTPILGDADGDLQVTITDFIIWKDDFINNTSLSSDFDNDGTVTLLDFITWKNAFLNYVPVATNTPLPPTNTSVPPTDTPVPTQPTGIITYDNSSSGNRLWGNSLTFSHIVGSGTNSVLLVGTTINNGGTVSNITYAGSNLTSIGSQINGSIDVELWYMLSPTAGNNNVVISYSGEGSPRGGAISFFGVNQTNPLGTPATNSGSNNSPTVNVPSATGDIVVDTLGGNDVSSITVGPNQTQRWFERSTDINAGSQETAIEGETTMSWALPGSIPWAIIGVALHP